MYVVTGWCEVSIMCIPLHNRHELLMSLVYLDIEMHNYNVSNDITYLAMSIAIQLWQSGAVLTHNMVITYLLV